MTKLYEGINLDFRPTSYFSALSVEQLLLSSIKGQKRQDIVRQALKEGRVPLVPEAYLDSALTADDRNALGRIHPSFMGGEYLPKFHNEEVEIARINIASTTSDVTSLLARRVGNRIHYRVVDEYGGDTLTSPSTRTSNKPLTLGQVESFFNGAWSIFDNLEMNFGDDGFNEEEMLNFTSPSSEFYPEFGELYCKRIVEWGKQRRGALPGAAFTQATGQRTT